MRVVAGLARGRALKAPPGKTTRPTTDLVRGALFSMLASREVDLSCTLDLYAGSGAMGIEALSRGAAWCDFVERDPRACAVIRENLRVTGFSRQAAVHTMDVAHAAEHLEGAYTLVLADPPYDDARAGVAIQRLMDAPLADEATVLAWERSSRMPVPPRVGAFVTIAERRHGDTMIVLYRHESLEEDSD